MHDQNLTVYPRLRTVVVDTPGRKRNLKYKSPATVLFLLTPEK
jgi:hypothetical protein